MTNDTESSSVVGASASTLEQIGSVKYYFQVTYIILTLVLILISNSLILVVIKRTRSLHTVTGYLMASLAVTDLTIGIEVGVATVTVVHDRWVLGEMWCSLTSLTSGVSIYATAYTLAVMSIDKLLQLKFPLRYNTIMTNKRAVIAIICVWVFSFLMNSYKLRGSWGTIYHPDWYICAQDFRGFPAITIITITLCPGLSLTTIVVCYTYMYTISQKATRSIQVQGMVTGSSAAQYKKNKKALITILIIVGVFFALWFPVIISQLVGLAYPNLTLPSDIAFLLKYLMISNSFINVLIYVTTNRAFRTSLKNIFVRSAQ